MQLEAAGWRGLRALHELRGSHMAIEFPAAECEGGVGGGLGINWSEPLWSWKSLLARVRERVCDCDKEETDRVAFAVHASLADLCVQRAVALGARTVLLSGGCFQNLLLTMLVEERLAAQGIECLNHQRVPANDSGISLGQAYYVLQERRRRVCV